MLLWFSSNSVTWVKKANQTSDSLSTVMFIRITSYHILEEGKTKWVFKHASRIAACNENEDGEVGVEGWPVGEQSGRGGGWMPWETGRGMYFVLCRKSPATQSRGNCNTIDDEHGH